MLSNTRSCAGRRSWARSWLPDLADGKRSKFTCGRSPGRNKPDDPNHGTGIEHLAPELIANLKKERAG